MVYRWVELQPKIYHGIRVGRTTINNVTCHIGGSNYNITTNNITWYTDGWVKFRTNFKFRLQAGR